MNLLPFFKIFCLVTPIRVATRSCATLIKPYDLTKEIRSDVYSELDTSLYGNIQWNHGLRDLQDVLVLTSFRYIKVLSKYFS